MGDSRVGCEGTAIIGLADDPEVAEFLRSLHEICHHAALEFAIRVGRLVVDTFYGGSWERWRKRGKSDPSLRRLARCQDLPLSMAQLYRCVAVSEVSHRLPGFSTWRNIGASHVRAVIGLAEQQQRRLLVEANQGHWTVHRLELEVRALRSAAASRRGRPPLSERSRQVSSIKRWLEDCPESFEAVEWRYLDASMRKALCERVLIVRTRCRKLEAMLGFGDRDVTSNDDVAPNSRKELSTVASLGVRSGSGNPGRAL